MGAWLKIERAKKHLRDLEAAVAVFRATDPGVLEGLLSESGFVDIKMATVLAPLRLSSADDALAFMQQAAGAYRAVVADLSDNAKADAWAEVREGFAQFENDTGFETDLELVIGSGAKPA